jgi:hypothetical protein
MAFIVNESFTTGSAPSGWGGTADFNYTTSPAPLEGTKSVHVEPGEAPAYTHGSTITGEQWGRFLFHPLALPSSFEAIAAFRDDSFESLIELTLNSTGTITLSGNGVGAFETTVGTMAADTTYHVFWRYEQGSGANGEMEVWFNTADDRAGTPANNHTSYASGTRTTGMKYLIFTSTGSGPEAYIMDLVQWADTDEFAGGGGRTTKNTRAFPLGMNVGMGFGIGGL